MTTRTHRSSFVGALCCAPALLAALAGPLAAQHDHGPGDDHPIVSGVQLLSSDDPLYTFKEAVYEAADPVAAHEALATLQAVIEDGQLTPEVSADGLRFVGHRLYALGDWDQSLAVFQQLGATPGAGEPSLDALRMVGQLQRLVFGDLPAAEAAYRELLEGAAAVAPSGQVDALRLEASGKLATLLLADGRLAEARSLSRAALPLAHGFQDLAEISHLSTVGARAAFGQGLVDEGRATLQGLAGLLRDQGDLAAWVAVQRELAGALPATDERLAVLAAVWQTPGLGQLPGYHLAGHGLAGLLLDAGERPAALEVLTALAAGLAAERPGLAGHHEAQTLALVHEDVLLTLLIEGDATLRAQALEQLAVWFPESERLEHVRRHVPEVDDLLSH